nr:hypothetical protein [Blastocatellia bacterium]
MSSLSGTGLTKASDNTGNDSRLKALANKTSSSAEAGSKNGRFCKPLPTQFRLHGFNYRQIVHGGGAAIYEQIWGELPNGAVGYEVIRIRRRDGFMIYGRSVEPAEVYPNSKAWGFD